LAVARDGAGDERTATMADRMDDPKKDQVEVQHG
jgi:hypothetical protein